MKGSEFVDTYAARGPATWERMAVMLGTGEGAWLWPFVEVKANDDGSAVFYVSSDYFAIGEEGDVLRMPLSPLAAQAIADAYGWLLPTKKMVDLIWKAAPVLLAPQRMVADAKMTSLPRFREHNVIVEDQLRKLGKSPLADLVAGQKKDVVISNKTQPGKVTIYGWHQLDGTPIQPLNPVSHDDHYADYSHGIRFVHPIMKIGGQDVRVVDVLTDAKRASLLSDEGPLHVLRYGPPPNLPAGYADPGPDWEPDVFRGESGNALRTWATVIGAGIAIAGFLLVTHRS